MSHWDDSFDRQRLRLVSGATLLPLTVGELRGWLREDDDWQNDVIVSLLRAATELVETMSGRQLLSATWELVLDRFPSDGVIWLPRPPLQSVTSVTYIDPAGATQTVALSDYLIDTASEPGRLTPAPGRQWPVTEEGRTNAVTVRYVAGWNDPSAVPEAARQAVRLLVAHWYEHREAATDRPPRQVDLAVRSLVATIEVPIAV